MVDCPIPPNSRRREPARPPDARTTEVTRLRPQGRLGGRRRDARARRHDRGGARRARGGPLRRGPRTGGVPHGLGRGRLDAASWRSSTSRTWSPTPARSWPATPTSPRPTFDRWAEAARSDAPLSRAAGPRARRAGAGLAAEGLRSAPGRQPDPAPRPELAWGRRNASRSCPPGARPYYCFAGRRPRTHARDLPARRGRLLRPGPGIDRRARLREGHLRAGPRRQQERARGPDAGLRAAAAYPRRWRRDGRRSWAGSASCSNPGSCWRGRCRRTRTSPSPSTTTRPARRSPSAAGTGRRTRRRRRSTCTTAGRCRRSRRRPRPAIFAHSNALTMLVGGILLSIVHRPARAGARDRAQAGAVARAREDPRAVGEEPRARPPGAPRPPHRAPQPRPRARPRRTADRAHGAAAGDASPEPCSSTSTASSTSTTTTATRPETSC